MTEPTGDGPDGTTATEPHGRPPALELLAVTKRYGSGPTEVRALTDVDLTVEQGELVALMGPSGSGKSTLLHLAGGLERPTAGRVIVGGTDIDTLDASGLAALRRHQVGFVFQSLNLVPTLTAVENVMLPLELDGVATRKARKQAAEALARVQVDGPLDRYPDDLSGGQQQRVAIARAIVGDRSLILADEPTGALDTDTGEEILRLLRARCDAGAAGVMVTHEARHAAWADRVVFLRDGVVVDETGADEPEALLSSEAGR
jgi:putative ABC transport system ATP-binding protein